VWNQFLNDVTQPALRLDGSLTATHKLHQEIKDVTTPGSIEELFDIIDYNKGGAVVRMIALALDRQYGSKTWSSTIESYLKLHEYNNAEANDLWIAASKQINQKDGNVLKKLTSWSNQEGYPLVTITMSGDEILWSQARFYNSNTDQPLKSKWWIPITYAIYDANPTTPTIAFAEKDIQSCEMSPNTCQAKLSSTSKCIKINVNTNGFYRVQYTIKLWNCLLNSFASLPVDDRSGLIDDVFSIAKSNMMDNNLLSSDYNIPLSFALQLKKEKDLSVWTPGTTHLLKILSTLATTEDTSCSTNMNTFYLSILDERVNELGIVPKSTDTHLIRLLRVKLVGSAAIHGHENTINLVKAIYSDKDQVNKLLPDEKSIVYKTIVRWGTVTEFNNVVELYKKATFAPDKKRYMYALAATKDPLLIQRVLNMALSNDVRNQDTVSLLAAVASYSEGRLLTWNFIKKNWNELYKLYGSGGFALTRLILIASHFDTKEMLEDITLFYNQNPVPAAERAVARAIEEVKASTAWKNNNADKVCKWLSTHV
jgi:aminopeptidase N